MAPIVAGFTPLTETSPQPDNMLGLCRSKLFQHPRAPVYSGKVPGRQHRAILRPKCAIP
jgi:hypothetical protein